MKGRDRGSTRVKLPSFGVRSVQKGRRITLDDSLLHNLGIKEGDLVELFLDTEEEAIIVKKLTSELVVEQHRNPASGVDA